MNVESRNCCNGCNNCNGRGGEGADVGRWGPAVTAYCSRARSSVVKCSNSFGFDAPLCSISSTSVPAHAQMSRADLEPRGVTAGNGM